MKAVLLSLALLFAPLPASAGMTLEDLNLTQEDVDTLLRLAAEAGDMGAVSLALDLGADPTADADNGWSAVMLAGLAGNPDVFERILQETSPARLQAQMAGDVTLVKAILVGEGGGDHTNVPRMLEILNRKVTYDLARRRLYSGDIRSVAMTLGYNDDLFAFEDAPYIKAPPPAPSWPEFSRITCQTDTPVRQDWLNLQSFLKQQGHYQPAAPNGEFDVWTSHALFRYLHPLNEVVMQNAIAAGRAGTARNRPLLANLPGVAVYQGNHHEYRSIYRIAGEWRFVDFDKPIVRQDGYGIMWTNAKSSDNTFYATYATDYIFDENAFRITDECQNRFVIWHTTQPAETGVPTYKVAVFLLGGRFYMNYEPGQVEFYFAPDLGSDHAPFKTKAALLYTRFDLTGLPEYPLD